MRFAREIRLRACEMPAGVSGFISFHFAVKPQNFTFAGGQTFHIPRQRDSSLYTLPFLWYARSERGDPSVRIEIARLIC